MRRRLRGSWVLAILACEPEPPSIETPILAKDGERCSAGSDCVSGACLPLAEPVCGQFCVDSDDCTRGMSCTPLVAPTELLRACLPSGPRAFDESCRADAECEGGLCLRGRCTALCGACPPGARCEHAPLTREQKTATWPSCRYRLAEPAIVFESVPTPEGGSAELSFEVPPRTASFVAVIESAEGLRVAPRTLTSPDGTMILDASGESINPSPSYIGVASVLVSNNDDERSTPRAGSWRLSVGTYDPADFENLIPVAGKVDRVSVIFEPEGEEGGALDLNLRFSPSTEISARTATDSPFVVALLAEIERTLGSQVGLTLGEVELGALSDAHDRVENGDETRAMCRDLSDVGRYGASVNVFVVSDLAYAAGHSGGTPGPPGRAGTTGSCIVIQKLEDGLKTGILASHELGHFLGLRHTTELTGGLHDPISDTPECPRGTSIDDCPDRGNLMFPSFLPESGLPLTDGQISVIRRNPTLYELPAGR